MDFRTAGCWISEVATIEKKLPQWLQLNFQVEGEYSEIQNKHGGGEMLVSYVIICSRPNGKEIIAMIAVKSRKIICSISQVLRNRENLRMNQRQLETSLEQIDAKDAPVVGKRGHDSMRDKFEN